MFYVLFFTNVILDFPLYFIFYVDGKSFPTFPSCNFHFKDIVLNFDIIIRQSFNNLTKALFWLTLLFFRLKSLILLEIILLTYFIVYFIFLGTSNRDRC